MQFVKHGSEPLTSPFLHPVTAKDGETSFVVVVHKEDIELVDDGLMHVYYNVPSNTTKDIYVLEHTDTTQGSQGTRGMRPDFLYVREGSDFEQLSKLVEFLNNHLYKLKDAEEEQIILAAGVANTDPFTAFTSQIRQKTGGSLEQYLREMLTSMGLSEEEIGHVLLYSNIFHVALIDEDMNSDPLANYELLEFIGDLAAWKPLDDIFLEYAEQHNIEMTEQVITAMHRSFASKEKQAQVAKKLFLNVYLKKKGEPTIDTYEDMFESFVGAMFMTNFHLRAVLSVDLNLHERFLRWVYKAWDLSTYEEKPEITKFYEYMRVLAGKSVFRERDIGGNWVMREEPGTQDLITKRLMNTLREQGILERMGEEPVVNFVKTLFADIRYRYPNDMHSYDSRRAKYSKINKLVEDTLSMEIIRVMTNRRNMEDWDDDVVERFSRLVNLREMVVSQRFVDKSRSNYYWVIQDAAGNTKYTTMDYDDAEDPETLINVIELQDAGREIRPSMRVERVAHRPSDDPFFLQLTNGDKFFLRGTPAAIETHVAEVYKRGEGRFYVVLSGMREGKTNLEYDPRPRTYISSENDDSPLASVKQLLMQQRTKYKPELSEAMHRYVGDRAAYGYTALVAVLHRKITNVHHLTDVRNFYRSKALKKELTKMFDVRDSRSDELVEFDQLIGKNMSVAEQVIMYVYLKVAVKPRVIFRPETRIRSIRMALYARDDAVAHKKQNAVKVTPEMRKAEERQRKRKSEIRVVDGKFVYETSDKVVLSLPISGFDNERVKGVFADWLLRYERLQNPDIDVIRNFRFSSMPEFDTLRQAMEFRNVEEWQLFRNKRGTIELRYFTKDEEDVIFIPGSDIESILRRL